MGESQSSKVLSCSALQQVSSSYLSPPSSADLGVIPPEPRQRRVSRVSRVPQRLCRPRSDDSRVIVLRNSKRIQSDAMTHGHFFQPPEDSLRIAACNRCLNLSLAVVPPSEGEGEEGEGTGEGTVVSLLVITG